MKLFSQSPIRYYEFKKKFKKLVMNIIALSMSSKIKFDVLNSLAETT